MPPDLHALAAHLPDLPHWVETRWLLRSEGARFTPNVDDPASGLVVGSVVPLGVVVGGPEPDTIRATLADLPADFEVIVQEDAIEVARIALPQWRSVWGADERNKASLRLAASVGIRPVERLWVLASA